LAPHWGDVFGNHLLSVARRVCRAWHGAFEVLSLVHLPAREGASIMKGDQLDPRIFAIARGIEFKGSSYLPSALSTPNFYAGSLTTVSIRCANLRADAVLQIVNAFVQYDPPVTLESDPFADGAHVVRERNVPNLRKLKVRSDAPGDDVAGLLYWIIQGSDIRDLLINNVSSSDQGMRAIARGLSLCRAVESFTVFGRDLTGACLARMDEMPLDRLKSLKLGVSCKDGDEVAAASALRSVFRLIARSDSMEDLEVNSFLRVDDALADFDREVCAKYGNEANGLKHPLKRIWIRNAGVRDEGALAFARFLQSGRSQLLQLTLIECDIRDAGVKAIVKELKDDKTLKLVDLSDARNDDDLELFGLAEQALAQNSVLKWLVMKITILETQIPPIRRQTVSRVKYSRWMLPDNYLTDPRWVFER